MPSVQDLVALKLKAIRETMSRPPAAVPAAKAKPVKPARDVKQKPVKKTAKLIKPNNLNNDGFAPDQYKAPSQREKVFKTVPLNLEDKIKIEVKRGLWVYVKPGADIEAIRAKYNAPKKLIV